ncbi:aldose epimerase family protein [Pedobacter sp. MW01-1-1]|uniref:aldose epimerase family protein n=1 Tax=Pedobacter sp. MW01-1-1 TaxID=3383027 RepID=UPI003FF01FE8
MSVQQIPTGYIIDDTEVIAVELSNSKGTLVKLFTYGAILNKFIVKNAKGEMQDIVLGFDRIEDYFDQDYLAGYPYLGTIIGRYANRIKNGSFVVDGKNYQVAQNAGKDSLHGGINGFDKKNWDIVDYSEEQNSVTFEYESEAGEENYPGNLVVALTFELTENDELILSYEAECDEATPINLTHHAYFNLSPTGETVEKHKQQIFASNYLEQDDNFSVTGKLMEVKNTAFDFTEAKEIGRDWNADTGYDQTFVLDKIYGDLSLASKTSEAESGLTLSVYTTEPVAHLYTSKYLNVKNGKAGRDYPPYSAFCIETQHHPNAINIAEFPSTVLQPDELYTQTTIFKVALSTS